MENWIDRLKQQEAGRDEHTSRQIEIRLHNAKIIKAKAPVLWAATIECIRADCSALRESFPDKRERYCHLDPNGADGVVIVNEGSLPRLQLSVKLNLDGQCVDLIEAVEYDRFQPASINKRGQIEITVNDLEELAFRYNGKAHTTPASLAQALVSRVCKISQAP